MKDAWRSYGWGCALIVLLTMVAYIPAMRGGFVFDDYALLINNPLIKTSDGLYRFWFTTQAPDYYPLTWSLWWVEWRLWGDNPMGYHVVNVLLHTVNAVLVWLILRRLKITGALVAGLIFAVHPVNAATVAWISEQKNTLSMLFYAAAILFYLDFDEEGDWRWFGYSLAAFLLALLSKTAIVMLPVVLLGCMWWVHDRVRWKDLLYSTPFFVLSLGLALVTIWFQSHRALVGESIQSIPFSIRLAMAGTAPWFYLCKVVLPVNLMVIYPRWDIDASRWISYVPGILLASSFAVFWWKRKIWGRAPLFGLGYFVVMLFPVLGFFNQGFYRYSFVADHWQYEAMVGVIALMVAGGERICRRMDRGHIYSGTVAAAVILLVLTATTWRRDFVYADDATLWRDNVARNSGAWLAHNNLGVYLQKEGKVAEALRCWEEALRLKPDYADAHYNLGLALWKIGRTGEAIGHWEEAVRLQPEMAEAHDKLGVALWQGGRTAEAVGEWQQAVRIKPDYADSHLHLGVALEQAGRLTEAVTQYEEVLRLKPDQAEAHYNLALALAEVGRKPEAIDQLQRTLVIRPEYAEAQNALARLRAVQ